MASNIFFYFFYYYYLSFKLFPMMMVVLFFFVSVFGFGGCVGMLWRSLFLLFFVGFCSTLVVVVIVAVDVGVVDIVIVIVVVVVLFYVVIKLFNAIIVITSWRIKFINWNASHSILPCPFSCKFIIFFSIRFIYSCNLWHQWIVWIWITEQRANW